MFDYISDTPIFDYSKLETWITPPVSIDSYSLLDTGTEGNWRIIGNTPDYSPGEKFKDVRFVYGTPPNALTAVDIFGKTAPITQEAAKGLPRYSARGDWHIKELLKDKFDTNT